MPLTSVVHYFNEYLPELHPGARLSGQARYHCIDGRIEARVAGYRLIPCQAPVLIRATGTLFAWSGKVLAESDAGRRLIPETLYVQAWDGEDVIFLDRFLRTLHALHHLSLGEDRDGLVVVDVHLRHLAALPEQHGRVFEDLLHRLGLAPDQFVLRLSGKALLHDPHVRAAALSFAGRGYHLLAVGPSVGDTDWALLRSLGVQWVKPDPADLRDCASRGSAADWARQARDQGIGLWVDGAAGPAAIAGAADLDADLIEDAPWASATHPGIRIRPNPWPVAVS